MRIPSKYLLATAGETRKMDESVIENLGISGRMLMEIAGAKTAAIIMNDFGPGAAALVFCGKGNNAGDALVAARYLSQNDIQVTIVFSHGTKNLSTEAAVNLDLLRKLQFAQKSNTPDRSSGGIPKPAGIAEEEHNAGKQNAGLNGTDHPEALEPGGKITIYEKLSDLNLPPGSGSFDILIDGLTGTGLKNEIRKPLGDMVDFINRYRIYGSNDGTGRITRSAGKPGGADPDKSTAGPLAAGAVPGPSSHPVVYALDVPTGLHSDEGKILGQCVNADKTIAYGAQKLGCHLESGPSVCGKIFWCDLGFPASLKSDVRRVLIDEEWADRLIKSRRSPRHKYEAGLVYVIAGSRGLTGAAIMAAESAWSEGLGAASVISPAGLMDIFESRLIHQTKFAAGSREDRFFKPSHLQEVLNYIKRREGTVILGPGLGRNEETLDFIRQFLLEYDGRVVVDADAVTAMGDHLPSLARSRAQMVLTPHTGELASLTAEDISTGFGRLLAVERLADTYSLTILSKGMPVCICTPAGKTFITNYDTTVFSRTGFGDILAGKIAALWELSGDAATGCIKALRDGKSKYDRHVKLYSAKPQPMDLI